MHISTNVPTALTGLAIYAVVVKGSPIAAPEPQITPFPNLVPTSPVDLATDTGGERTISPLRVPAHEVTLGRRDANAPVTVDGIVWPTGFPNLVPTKAIHIAIGDAVVASPLRVVETAITLGKRSDAAELERREANPPVTVDNIVWPTGFPDLVPTKPVHLALGAAVSASPLRVADAAVTLEKRGEPVTLDGVVYPTGYPNLVPTSTVDLATDSTFTTKDIPAATTWSTVSETDSASAVATLHTEAVLLHCVANVSGTAYTTACPTTSATKTYSPVTVDGVVFPTGFPDLVPSTTVHLSTAAATVAQYDTVDKKQTSAGAAVRQPFAGSLKALLRALRQ